MDLRFKLACLHHNHHRFEILEDEEHRDSLGIAHPMKCRRSNAQGRATTVRQNLPPSHGWKVDLLEAIKERCVGNQHHFADSDDNEEEDAWDEVPNYDGIDDLAELMSMFYFDDD